MKGVGAEIHHKTEAGLVVLGVEGARGGRRRPTACSKSGPAGALEAVLVEQMIASNRELMVGMKRDAVFGPVVAFGLGGVLTEALGDVALAVAPLDDARSRRTARPHQGQEAARLVPRLSAGGPGRAGQRSSRPSARWRSTIREIAEIDVNPLLVRGRPARRGRRAHHPLGEAAAEAGAVVVHAEPQGPARSAVHGRGRALPATSTKWGGSALQEHPRRRLQGHHLSGEPQGRRVLRPAGLHEHRRTARGSRPGPAGRGRPPGRAHARAVRRARASRRPSPSRPASPRPARAGPRPSARSPASPPRAASPSWAPTAWA